MKQIHSLAIIAILLASQSYEEEFLMERLWISRTYLSPLQYRISHSFRTSLVPVIFSCVHPWSIAEEFILYYTGRESINDTNMTDFLIFLLFLEIFAILYIIILSMSYRLFVFLSSFWVLVMLIGFFYWLYLSDQKSAILETWMHLPPPQASIIEQYATSQAKKWKEEKESSDAMNMIIRSWSLRDCDWLTQSGLVSECRDRVAFRAIVSEGSGANACMNLTSSHLRDECKNTLLYQSATKSGTLHLCDEITGNPGFSEICRRTIEKNRYLEMLASWTLTHANCLGFTDTHIESSCIRQVIEKDEGKILSRALEWTDPHACDALVYDDNRILCQNEVQFRLAMINKDDTLCAQITDTKRRDLCRSNLLSYKIQSITRNAVTEDDLSLCESLDTPRARSCRESVWMARVRSTRDASLCQHFTTARFITTCHEITVR